MSVGGRLLEHTGLVARTCPLTEGLEAVAMHEGLVKGKMQYSAGKPAMRVCWRRRKRNWKMSRELKGFGETFQQASTLGNGILPRGRRPPCGTRDFRLGV